MLRLVPFLLIGALGGPALAQPGPVEPTLAPPTEAVAESRAVAWPLMLDIHALLGIEPHSTRGTPIAFGAGAEVLWRARIGGFAELLSSEGTALIAPTVAGVMLPGFGDRVSVPFGVASRPLAWSVINRPEWWARLLAGIGVQLGLTIEHVRTSDDAVTTAGLHAAIGADVPLYGGPKQGGIALRLYARLLVTPSINLDKNTVFEPVASGQLFCGLSYYP
ncbi:MAG: hypothetical protein ACXVCV_16295 [Polyangia bacterium]